MVVAASLLVADALIAWAWVFRYRRHRWAATDYGRHLMRFSALIAVALTGTLVLEFTPWPAPVDLSISALVYAGIGVELLNRHRLLSRAQHDDEDPPHV